MKTSKLKYMSEATSLGLMKGVASNLERYLSGSFSDLADTEGWKLELSLDVDLSCFEHLKPDRSPEAEVLNSMLVWRALGRLTPSLAAEGRLWTRLSHIEGIEYSRARWLANVTRDDAPKAVATHFFADTQTKCRDDNSIGRLWWAAYIAHLAVPENQFGALKAILKTADIRSNVIERSAVSSRTKIAAAIVRAITDIPEVSESEDAFRTFMKNVNRSGGGILFEAMPDDEIDRFMKRCVGTSDRIALTGT
jgi:hypothetical protein